MMAKRLDLSSLPTHPPSTLPFIGVEERDEKVSALKKSMNFDTASGIEIVADLHELLRPIVTPYDPPRAMNIVSELLEREPVELLHYIADPRSIMVAVLSTINSLKDFESRRRLAIDQSNNNTTLAPPSGVVVMGGGRANVEQTA